MKSTSALTFGHRVWRRSRLVLWLAALLAVVVLAGWPLEATEYRVLPLQGPGQATVSIDRESNTAYIVDLGKAGDGDKVLVGDKPLLDKLEAEGIRRLAVICSHPHADHMGGIRALFEQPTNFYRDAALTVPRFEKVLVVEQEVPNSLASTLEKSLPAGRASFVERSSAATGNALAGVSAPTDSVFVETIPYTPRDKAGPHGRSIVTRTVLGGQYSILDPDDADSYVIKQVTESLKSRGVKTIDAFIVPHHGSAYQDLEPLLSLGPRKAIIAVNPRNQYGHPSPTILRELMDRLGPSNVLFTGSLDNIKVEPSGVTRATYTAANRDSYGLFVAPSRMRKEKRGELTDQLAAEYRRVREMMFEASPARLAESSETTTALMRTRVAALGSTLSPEHDLGYIGRGGLVRNRLGELRLFAQGSARADSGLPALYLTADGRGAGSPGGPLGRVSELELSDRLALDGSATTRTSQVELRFDSGAGIDNGLEPRRAMPIDRTVTPRSADGVTAQARAEGVPDGGMVYLTGDKMFTASSASELVGGTLDVCGSQLCVIGVADSTAYSIPIEVDALLAEVWDRVYTRGVDAFYLSINPTRESLDEASFDIDSVPEDRLLFGSEEDRDAEARNAVVTAGGIERTRVGRILWEADVAFKSESLGFDVLSRASRSKRKGLAAGSSGFTQADLEVAPEARWCRLYWSSGSQEIEVDREAATVKLTGFALVAKAEPMRLEDGRLVSARGGWCADAKGVAAQLGRRANAAGPNERPLGELRRVAEMQSLLRWAREHGVVASPGLLEAIDRVRESIDWQVPSWTSGVRSSREVLVQVERRDSERVPTHLVHVSFSSGETLEDCVLPAWDQQLVDFPKKGYVLNESTGTWEGGIEGSRFLRKWMTKLAKEIAECADGALLPENDLLPGDTLFATSERSVFGVELHLQPVHYHGGVFLGAQEASRLLETAWREAGVLRGPDGRLLFHRVGDDLHFWSAREGDDRTPSGMRHVVVRGGDVIDAHATDGRLRFLVEADPGGVVRSELRGLQVAAFGGGFEYAFAAHASDGDAILHKAAWPCDRPVTSDCVRTVDLGEDALAEALGEEADLLDLTRTTLVEPSTWLVDMDLRAVKAELDRRWEALSDEGTASALVLARAYADWGFIDEAISMGADLVDEVALDSEDFVLAGGVLPTLESELLGLLVAELLQIEVARIRLAAGLGGLEGEQVLRQLRELEPQLDAMAPELASESWSAMASVSSIAREAAQPDSELYAVAEEASKRYESAGRRARALADGIGVETTYRAHRRVDGGRFQGVLAAGTTNRHLVPLGGASDYTVTGSCYRDCSDLDLAVYGPDGGELGSDTAYDPDPYVVFSGEGLDEVAVEVKMVACDREGCEYNLRLEEGNTVPESDPAELLEALEELARTMEDGLDWWQEGSLAQGESTEFELELEQGVEYAIAGLCDFSCYGLAFTLFDEDRQMVASDPEAGDAPELSFSADRTGLYRLKVDMLECEALTCEYRIDLQGSAE